MEDLRAEFRTLTARAPKLVTEGATLRSRIGAGLHSKYGFTSETLLRFGFKPRRPPRRRSKKETPEAAKTAPAAQAEAEEPVKTQGQES